MNGLIDRFSKLPFPHEHIRLFREIVAILPEPHLVSLHTQLRHIVAKEMLLGRRFGGELVAILAKRIPPTDESITHFQLRRIGKSLQHEECRKTAIVALANRLPRKNEAAALIELHSLANTIQHAIYRNIALGAVHRARQKLIDGFTSEADASMFSRKVVISENYL